MTVLTRRTSKASKATNVTGPRGRSSAFRHTLGNHATPPSMQRAFRRARGPSAACAARAGRASCSTHRRLRTRSPSSPGISFARGRRRASAGSPCAGGQLVRSPRRRALADPLTARLRLVAPEDPHRVGIVGHRSTPGTRDRGNSDHGADGNDDVGGLSFVVSSPGCALPFMTLGQHTIFLRARRGPATSLRPSQVPPPRGSTSWMPPSGDAFGSSRWRRARSRQP